MLHLVLTLAIIGLVLWLIETQIPMDPTIKTAIRVIVLVCVVLWLLEVFGLFSYDIPVPRFHGP